MIYVIKKLLPMDQVVNEVNRASPMTPLGIQKIFRVKTKPAKISK